MDVSHRPLPVLGQLFGLWEGGGLVDEADVVVLVAEVHHGSLSNPDTFYGVPVGQPPCADDGVKGGHRCTLTSLKTCRKRVATMGRYGPL